MRHRGYRLFFYSNEGREPPHVHVERPPREVKFWLAPVELAKNIGFATHEVRRIRALVIANREYLWEVWHEFFRH